MTTATHRRPVKTPASRFEFLTSRDQATALLGVLASVWLFVGAWILGYAEYGTGGQAYLNESIVGVLLLFCALTRLLRPLAQLFPSVLTMILGAWLIISPFIWNYAEAPYRAADSAGLQWATGAFVLLLGVAGMMLVRAARRTKPAQPRAEVALGPTGR